LIDRFQLPVKLMVHFGDYRRH